MTPEEREQFVEAISDKVVEKLTPRLDEWFDEFEETFVRNYASTFNKHFEDCIKGYQIRGVFFEKREV